MASVTRPCGDAGYLLPVGHADAGRFDRGVEAYMAER